LLEKTKKLTTKFLFKILR